MFSNRIAIVTGGGSGIGRAVCQILAKENGSVIVADINLKNVNETVNILNNPNNHLPVEVDVSNLKSVNAMFEHVSQRFGANSVACALANCAGITRDSWMLDMTEENFNQVIDVNLKGTFFTTQQFCKRIIGSNKPGSIVNISSVSAKIGNIGQANYVASKAAVEGFSRTVAREMGRYNIRCNAIIPGFIQTPMIETVPDKVMGHMMKQTPLGRTGNPEEVAQTIAFLLSDKSSYVTGTLVQISGGFAM